MEKRTYKATDWNDTDPINQALSEANALLYGLCHAAIVSLGYSAGLGFVHTGKQLSFVYDIADLYKTETTIPAAFEAVKRGGDISKNIRVLCRTYFSKVRLMERIPEDIAFILENPEVEWKENEEKAGELWDENDETIAGGKNYAERGEGL